MKPYELYDILTLDDNKDYTIANMINYNDATYLYLIEIDKDENIIENNQVIVKRVLVDGEDSVEFISDKEELKTVSREFFELFKDDMDNE